MMDIIGDENNQDSFAHYFNQLFFWFPYRMRVREANFDNKMNEMRDTAMFFDILFDSNCFLTISLHLSNK